MSVVLYSERRMAEERRRWDEDDRVRCGCVADHALEGKDSRCLRSTRHPSGKCVDCRVKE